jgi:hypothetical protein
MFGMDLILSALFVAGIAISLSADFRLRRTGPASWATGCTAVAGATLVLVACAAAIR